VVTTMECGREMRPALKGGKKWGRLRQWLVPPWRESVSALFGLRGSAGRVRCAVIATTKGYEALGPVQIMHLPESSSTTINGPAFRSICAFLTYDYDD
jgi:hypothetical protein